MHLHEPFFVSVMGTIGSGKTTATRLLSSALGWQFLEENFGENAFLPRFYQDMHAWAFHSQTFFLMEKISQIMSVEGMLTMGSVVQDTPIYQDVYGYARAHHLLHNMDAAEWALYQKIFRSFESFLPKPDLVIYLATSIPTVQKRIRGRGRQYEQSVQDSYLALLEKNNEQWLSSAKDIQILSIDTDDLDLVHSVKARERFVSTVKKALGMGYTTPLVCKPTTDLSSKNA